MARNDRSDRDYDIALLGATGFTGGLIARYLAEHAPPTTRLALAGRNPARLESVAASLARPVGIVRVDAGDPAGLASLAGSTRVLVTTVGPYLDTGEPVVAACAAAGTDYLDLTGEPEFLDLMYLKHHATAVHSGARLVHACGFDSMPHDLGAQFTVDQLPEGVPLTVRAAVRVNGTISGGTAASALGIMARLRQGNAVHAVRTQVEPALTDRQVRSIPGRVHKDPDSSRWLLPMPTIDPLIVAASARALPRYGPDFTYCHQLAAGGPARTAATMAGVGVLFGLAHLPPARRALLRLRPAGSGPTEAQRAAAWFSVRFVGEGGGERVVTEVAGGDPGYTETSKMISEAALSLVHDELPPTSGQVTTAVALGRALRLRLQRAGIVFRVL